MSANLAADVEFLAEKLEEAGWALYDAANVAATTEGQTAAFDAAELVGQALKQVGKFDAGQKLLKTIAIW